MDACKLLLYRPLVACGSCTHGSSPRPSLSAAARRSGRCCWPAAALEVTTVARVHPLMPNLGSGQATTTLLVAVRGLTPWTVVVQRHKRTSIRNKAALRPASKHGTSVRPPHQIPRQGLLDWTMHATHVYHRRTRPASFPDAHPHAQLQCTSGLPTRAANPRSSACDSDSLTHTHARVGPWGSKGPACCRRDSDRTPWIGRHRRAPLR